MRWYLVTYGDKTPWTVRAPGPAAAVAKAALKMGSIHSYAELTVKSLVDCKCVDDCSTPSRTYYVSLGVKHDQYAEPWDFPEKEKNALLAVNSARVGELETALDSLGIRIYGNAAQIEAVRRAKSRILAYYIDKRERSHWHAYLHAARLLEEVGL